jgi:hypothetical protein
MSLAVDFPLFHNANAVENAILRQSPAAPPGPIVLMGIGSLASFYLTALIFLGNIGIVRGSSPLPREVLGRRAPGAHSSLAGRSLSAAVTPGAVQRGEPRHITRSEASRSLF